MNDYLEYYTLDQIKEMFNFQTFTPFEDPQDRRSVRNLTYLICREKPELYSEGMKQSRKKSKDDAIEIYVPIDEETYACIAYADFHYEKIKNDSDMIRLFPDKLETEQLKLDYIFTAEPYRGLGLASMMIAMMQDECRLRNIPIFRLDSLKDYVFDEDGVVDKNDAMYRAKGFIEIPGDYTKENVKPKFMLITQVASAQEIAQDSRYTQLDPNASVDYQQAYDEEDGQIISFEDEEFIEYPSRCRDDISTLIDDEEETEQAPAPKLPEQ